MPHGLTLILECPPSPVHTAYRLVYWGMSVYENSVFYFGCLSQTLLLKFSGVKGHLSKASAATSSPSKKIFLSKWQDHTPPPKPLCSWLCTANNQPWVPMFSYSRLKSLKALLDGTVVSPCLFWELLGFLPEFLSRRKRGLICPQPEQEVAFTAADWNGKPGSDPPPKSSPWKRMKFQLSAPIWEGPKASRKSRISYLN